MVLRMAGTLFTGPEAICIPYTGRTTEDGRREEGEPYGSVEGQGVGNDIYEMINDAVRKSDDDLRVRAVAECVRRFPRETLRHPEVFFFLEYLAKEGDTAALVRILADRPRRGRPARTAAEEFGEAAIVERIMKREGCAASEAAPIARREHPQVFGHKSERTIENEYSAIREAFHLAFQHRWLPGSKVTDFPWTRPGGPQRRR